MKTSKEWYWNIKRINDKKNLYISLYFYFNTFGKGNNGSTRLLDVQGPIGINANELLSLLNSSSQ